MTRAESAAFDGIEAVLVDLDGTMVDTLGDFHAALNAMLAELELPAVDRATVARCIGKGSEHLVASALAYRGLSHDPADALARYPGRNGLRRARAALPLLRTRSESPRESVLRVIIVLAGLPEPECNYNVFDEQGRFLARGDLVYPDYKLLLEYQGDQHRTDRAQWRSDIHRLGRLEDAGWQVLQFTDDDLRDPAALVARVARRLRARGATLGR